MSECQGWDWNLIDWYQILPSTPSAPPALPLISHRNLAAQHMGKEGSGRSGKQDKGGWIHLRQLNEMMPMKIFGKEITT